MSMKSIGILAVITCLAGIIPPAQAGDDKPKDLHIKSSSNVGGMFVANDKRGNRWDIRLHQGMLGSGTNNNLANSPYLRIGGSSFRTNGQGKRSKDGKEIEVGPWTQHNLRISRRIRFFSSEGIARWLDIYENPTDKAITIVAEVRVQMNFGHRKTITIRGKNSVGKEDWGFYTVQGNTSMPQVLHVPFGPEAENRPAISLQGNYYRYTYKVTVPPKDVAVVAYFLGQETSTKVLAKRMKEFDPGSYFTDLSPALRQRIVNFNFGGGGLRFDIDRSKASDQVELYSGDRIFGSLANDTFTLASRFGPMEIPAGQVLGALADPADRGALLVLLADGQIVRTESLAAPLAVSIPAVGRQDIPAADIKAFAFQIDENRPAEVPFRGPYLRFRTGERLGFAEASLPLTLTTPAGEVPLDADAIASIRFETEKQPAHVVTFRNGSTLTGLCATDAFDLTLRQAGSQSIARADLAGMVFTNETDTTDAPASAQLANGDHLRGRLGGSAIELTTAYGPVSINPANVRSVVADADQAGQLKVTIWNGSVLTGTIDKPLTFQITPGPAVQLTAGQIKAVQQKNPLPPEQIAKRIEALIKKLGSESYQDRQDAQKQLIEIGPAALPLLQEFKEINDPEVKQRIKTIIESIGPAQSIETDDADELDTESDVPQMMQF